VSLDDPPRIADEHRSEPLVEPSPPPPAEGPRRLDPRVVAVWRLGGVVQTGMWTAGAALALFAFDRSLYWALGLLVAGVLHMLIVPPLRYRHWSYRVGEVDVRVRYGWLWRTVSVVLHSRIQHVDTRQGPLERMLGLATVVMFTAGSVGARVEIPGLPEAEAEALRDRLVSLSGRGDAV
jgi:uncharacterized protein